MRVVIGMCLLLGAMRVAVAADPIPFDVRWAEREIDFYKRLVAAEIFDPESAQFRHLYYREHKSGVVQLCGEINAKNKMGSRIGFMLFHARFLGTFPTQYAEIQFAVDDTKSRVEAACTMPPR